MSDVSSSINKDTWKRIVFSDDQVCIVKGEEWYPKEEKKEEKKKKKYVKMKEIEIMKLRVRHSDCKNKIILEREYIQSKSWIYEEIRNN